LPADQLDAYTQNMEPNDRLSDFDAPAVRPLIGARRDQIVSAAAVLFAEQGYHGTSMQEIAERVGMLKGSLYAHVANKEEILLEIVSTASRLFTDAVRPVMLDDDPPAFKLRRALVAHLSVIAANRAVATVFLFEWRHLEGQPLRWFGEVRERYEALWDGLIDMGQAAGALTEAVEPRMAVRLMLSAAAGACQWIPEISDGAGLRIADALADLVLRHGSSWTSHKTG
jgi:TetR/AcrR family transcriptional regulator, cholesterol catabolism regulator